MDARRGSEATPMKNRTIVERTSDREMVVTRTFDAPAHIVFEAWTRPDLFKRWWIPKSCGISFLSCEMDVRTGGTYRFEFGHSASEQPMTFFVVTSLAGTALLGGLLVWRCGWVTGATAFVKDLKG